MRDRVTLTYFATVLGVTRLKASKDLRRIRWAFPPDRQGLYDPRAVDLLRAMRGLPHRPIEPAHKDWLARYVEELNDHTIPQGPAPRADR